MNLKGREINSIFSQKDAGLSGEKLDSPSRFLLPLIMGFLVFVFCYPLVFIIIGSFMNSLELEGHLGGMISGSEGYAQMPLIPLYPTLESFIELLIDTPSFYPLFWNSLIITLVVLVGQVLVAIPASWVFAQYNFFAKRTLFFLYVVAMMMPFQVMMLPQYLVLSGFGLLDTLLAIIVPGVFSAFPVFVLTYFFKNIPQSTLDAARLDGASELNILLHIGVPLVKPGIFAVLFLDFIEYWNVIEQPLVFLRDQTIWPLSLFLPSAGLEQASLIFVATFIACIPAFLSFMWGRKYLEQGIASLTKG